MTTSSTETGAHLRAPFAWFGGKSRVSDHVWERLGAQGPDACAHYIEPFLGSAAVLLGRPGGGGKLETVNDADGFLINLWRALRAAPAALAEAMIGPVAEVDKHARHLSLVERGPDLVSRLLSDPHAYDLELASWWLWGQCTWFGKGWCENVGPWGRTEDGTFGRVPRGQPGARVMRQGLQLGSGNGVLAMGADLPSWFARIAERLQRVRIAQGDWQRVVCPTALTAVSGPVAVFLDPPYEGYDWMYSGIEGVSISAAVREWALTHGEDPRFRIALCGYDGEHAMPGWSEWAWRASGGWGNRAEKQGRENAHRERVWFSPHCLSERKQLELFDV